MGWATLIAIVLIIGLIHEMAEKGEQIQKNNDKEEKEAIANKNLVIQLEKEKIQAENENLRLKKQDQRVVIGLSSSNLLCGSGLIIVGVISVILFFKQIYSI